MKNWIKELYHFITLRMLFPWQYRRYSKNPLEKNKVVFIETNLPGLSSNLTLIYQELEKRGGYCLKIHCLRESYVGKASYIRNAMNCLKDMATAGNVFLRDADRMVSCIHPREYTVITQVWHGCGAFKKFGMSTTDLLYGGNDQDYIKYPYYGNLNYVTVSSPEVIWAYEEAMNLKDTVTRILPIGISRTDVFFRKDFLDSARKHVYDEVPQAAGRKILLYAPTYRGSLPNAAAPEAMDIQAMMPALEKEYVLLIKHHPFVKQRPRLPEETSRFAFDVTDRISIEELICVSDVCISDYSSLVFEYSLFERPMIFYAFDLEAYGEWRGFYYDYDELTPGPVVRTTKEIIHYIQNLETEFDHQKVLEFKNKFMSACDGNATERIIQLAVERRSRL